MVYALTLTVTRGHLGWVGGGVFMEVPGMLFWGSA